MTEQPNQIVDQADSGESYAGQLSSELRALYERARGDGGIEPEIRLARARLSEALGGQDEDVIAARLESLRRLLSLQARISKREMTSSGFNGVMAEVLRRKRGG